ncbi:MAG: serine protease [Polaromonas sp.]|uniref:S1 family peptidase n=1 Tax=Polaromonas sp. TaxID=1869339 RepID=UPI00272FA6D5|nr:serine protease [Polaromonas sp.]MDP2451061.1 serine protease [Polaromonas sp.]MDP3248210.1 serine protease [Polaromonas sp.]MDP3757576.1 serine protease [Polaromonas sp.]
MKYSKVPSFKSMPLTSEVGKVAARVLAIAEDGTVSASGTCVRIGVGLYLSAKHVVEDFIDSFGQSNLHMNFSIWIVHLYEGPVSECWALTNVWTASNTDIAVLRAIAHTDGTKSLKGVNTVGLDLSSPPVGDRVVSYGFCKSRGVLEVDTQGVKLDIWGDPITSVGEVREIHHQMRDPVLRNFPCFQVNARFEGGMSGGPIFSDAGQLCGVVCSGYALDADDSEAISYGSTLWPALCIPLTVDVQTGSPCEPYCLLELANRGLIHVNHAQRLKAVAIKGGGFSGVYTPAP